MTSFSAPAWPNGRVASIPSFAVSPSGLAGIQDGAEASADHDEIAIGLDASGHGPEDVRLVEDVDVVVHDDHELEVVIHAEHHRDGVLGLAGSRLLDGHVGGERRPAGGGHVHGPHAGDHATQGVADLGLAQNTQGEDVVGRAPGGDRVEPRAFPHHDGARDEDISVLRRENSR